MKPLIVNDIENLTARFERFIIKTSDCWEWNGCIDKNYGYGRFRFNNVEYKAHRVAFYLSAGHLPEDLCVCHSCDNRRCVNPKHLWLGTLNDNIQDCKRKGRLNRAKHEQHSQAKLNMNLAEQIRQLYKQGNVSRLTLAKRFHVGPTAIERIVTGKTWVGDN